MAARKRAVRVARNMTLSPRSEAILSALTERTGVTRGRIVDVALANIGACETCGGRGTADGHMGRDTETCVACAGDRLVPSSP